MDILKIAAVGIFSFMLLLFFASLMGTSLFIQKAENVIILANDDFTFNMNGMGSMTKKSAMVQGAGYAGLSSMQVSSSDNYSSMAYPSVASNSVDAPVLNFGDSAVSSNIVPIDTPLFYDYQILGPDLNPAELYPIADRNLIDAYGPGGNYPLIVPDELYRTYAPEYKR